ncbi:PEP-CTERM sorting domain-containing protein [Gemmatimonas sp.]
MRRQLSTLVLASTFCLASTASAQTVINFDNLSNNTVVTNQYAGVSFSSTAGNTNYITAQSSYNGSKPNFLCSGPVNSFINCTASTTVTFESAVSGVSLKGMGINDVGNVKVAQVDLYNGLTFLGSQNILGNGEGYNPLLIDLSSWGSITRFDLTNITDSGGIGWDDITYTSRPTSVPEPSSLALVAAGLVGVAAARRRRA